MGIQYSCDSCGKETMLIYSDGIKLLCRSCYENTHKSKNESMEDRGKSSESFRILRYPEPRLREYNDYYLLEVDNTVYYICKDCGLRTGHHIPLEQHKEVCKKEGFDIMGFFNEVKAYWEKKHLSPKNDEKGVHEVI